ncbi:hypothetical protein D047_4194A, partial [Vibrio parahaemolyticus VPTS-2010_2]
MWLGL